MPQPSLLFQELRNSMGGNHKSDASDNASELLSQALGYFVCVYGGCALDADKIRHAAVFCAVFILCP